MGFVTRSRGFALLVVACAMPAVASLAQRPSPQPDVDPASLRNVQAVELQSTGSDGQTSWMIEPDVPRIPKIAGSTVKLSPHIERRLSNAFDLAQRGATYSADSRFRLVLELCAQDIDAREGGTRRREALSQGFVALLEADDFGAEQLDWRYSSDARQKAICHSTPVLKQSAQSAVDARQALQTYYAFAEQRLTFACEGEQGASLAYYGLARTLVGPGTQVNHAAGKAALLQKVALNIEPKNVLAGNELGVLLAQHGQLESAENLFEQCVATNATPETYKNLAVVYKQQGDHHASRLAMEASEALTAEKARQTRGIGNLASGSTANDPRHSKEAEPRPTLMAKLKDMTPKLSNPFRR